MDWMTATHDHTLTYTASGIGCNDRKMMLWLQLKQIINLNNQSYSYNIKQHFAVCPASHCGQFILEFRTQEPYVQCFSQTHDHVPP